MARLKEHREHLAPQGGGLQRFEDFYFAARCLGFVFGIARFEGATKQVVQIRCVRRREQRPRAVFHDAFHEQVRQPIGCVHVVRTTAIITRVLTQFEELFNIKVPRLEICADRAFALATLVHGNGRVVHYFEERYNALRLAVGALDV